MDWSLEDVLMVVSLLVDGLSLILRVEPLTKLFKITQKWGYVSTLCLLQQAIGSMTAK